jgi:large subunit ribosomal protein L4
MSLLIVQPKTTNTLSKINMNKFNLHNIRYDLIHQVISWQQNCKRNIIASTKTISEVKGSTKKLYRQKGTGNARHGSNRRVQFRGGAVVFGPTNKKKYSFKINKKIRKIALIHSIIDQLVNNNIIVKSTFPVNNRKTKSFIFLYKSIINKATLFVDVKFNDDFVQSHKNLKNVKSLLVFNLSTFDIVSCDTLIFSKGAIQYLIDRLL